MAELVTKRPLPVAESGSVVLFEITSNDKHFSVKSERLYFRREDAQRLHTICRQTFAIFYITQNITHAGVAELADAPDLGSGVNRCAGSSPVTRTKAKGYIKDDVPFSFLY